MCGRTAKSLLDNFNTELASSSRLANLPARKNTRRPISLACSCVPPRQIRASTATATGPLIRCDQCGQPFPHRAGTAGQRARSSSRPRDERTPTEPRFPGATPGAGVLALLRNPVYLGARSLSMTSAPVVHLTPKIHAVSTLGG
jgi:hypothetical protein